MSYIDNCTNVLDISFYIDGISRSGVGSGMGDGEGGGNVLGGGDGGAYIKFYCR